MLLALLTAGLSLVSHARAHGHHEQQPIPADANWAMRHMAEEHHITSFDAGSFFSLHDYDSSNEWTREDLLKTYGLKDESTNHISQSDKDAAVEKVIKLYDRDLSGTVSFAEYTIGVAQNIELPDFGFGPGHHGDDEYEYEIHHFEKYHGEDATEEELTHPEDIEHFRKHDMLDAQQERQEQMDRRPIVEENIPMKYRLEAQEIHFGRHWFYVAAGVLAWAAFWEMANRHAGNAQALAFSWFAVLIAIVVAYTL